MYWSCYIILIKYIAKIQYIISQNMIPNENTLSFRSLISNFIGKMIPKNFSKFQNTYLTMTPPPLWQFREILPLFPRLVKLQFSRQYEQSSSPGQNQTKILHMIGIQGNQPQHIQNYISSLKTLKIKATIPKNGIGIYHFLQELSDPIYQKYQFNVVSVLFEKRFEEKTLEQLCQIKLRISIEASCLCMKTSCTQMFSKLENTLKFIKLYNVYFESPQQFIQVLRSLKVIDKMNIFNKDSDTFVSLEGYKRLAGETMSTLASTIKQFHLSYLPFQKQCFRRFLFQNLYINHLTLKGCQVTDQHFLDIYDVVGRTLPQLEKLSILEEQQKEQLTYLGIECIVHLFKTIKYLSLNNCSLIGNRSIQLICQNFRDLVHLHLVYCQVNDRGFIYLKQLRQIRQINIQGNVISFPLIKALFCRSRNSKPSQIEIMDDYIIRCVGSKSLKQNLKLIFRTIK